MAYDEATIYFMTGTGNSYRAATWMAAAAGAVGVTARVVSFEQGRPAEEVREGPAHLLGLVFPTHGFTAPWAMVRFALRLPRRRGTHAFVMPTRAGSHIGSFFTPGLEGTGGYLIALILVLKGYRLRGVLGLDMPSNWMLIHPSLRPATVEGIVTRAQARVDRFMARLLAGGRYIGGLVPLLFGLLLLPVSLAYLLMGRFILAKLFFASERCNGCGLCVEYCSSHALRMWGRKKRRPYWTYACESCMRCMAFCPRQAVEAGHSWGVALYFVIAFPAMDYLVNWLAGWLPWLPGLNVGVGNWIIQYPYKLLSAFLAYVLFTLLIRIPLVNHLFTWTTLTHFYRRYRAPGTRLRDLHERGSELGRASVDPAGPERPEEQGARSKEQGASPGE